MLWINARQKAMFFYQEMSKLTKTDRVYFEFNRHVIYIGKIPKKPNNEIESR